MSKSSSSSSEDAQVSRYAEAAIEHMRASEAGDYRAANRAHDVVVTIYSRLRRQGYNAQATLLPLLQHRSPAVRGWAGAHALEFAPERGEPILEQLAREPGAVGLSAEMTLQQWRKGALRFPEQA